MPPIPAKSIAQQITNLPKRFTNNKPLWQGPCSDGPLGGVTQSMLQRFLSCRERFRAKYILGLEPPDMWSKNFGYGNIWHVCEEWHAKNQAHEPKLIEYCKGLIRKYPMQQEEITKWYNVCCVQFPEYVKYWSAHPDVTGRTPLMQEQVFDVPYQLPSSRIVRLRGKFDSVDLIDGGIWLQENKTKGDIDQLDVERQLKFDTQTMMYLIALENIHLRSHVDDPMSCLHKLWYSHKIKGVRYNVVRRPLSGGKGSIRPHAAKSTKNKITPAETDREFYERLRADYIAAEPEYWFFRVKSEVSVADIQRFKDQFFHPFLEQLCWWYDEIIGEFNDGDYGYPSMNYRYPFGGYNAVEEAGFTEYDAFLDTGSTSGLRQVDKLFGELSDA